MHEMTSVFFPKAEMLTYLTTKHVSIVFPSI